MSRKKRKTQKGRQAQVDKEEWRSSARVARENLRNIDKPRKPIAKSFPAKFDGDECRKCFLNIKAGETVRYDSDGFLIHARHKQEEKKYEICNSCFLTLPCTCDE